MVNVMNYQAQAYLFSVGRDASTLQYAHPPHYSPLTDNNGSTPRTAYAPPSFSRIPALRGSGALHVARLQILRGKGKGTPLPGLLKCTGPRLEYSQPDQVRRGETGLPFRVLILHGVS